jgi:hypothetical protein
MKTKQEINEEIQVTKRAMVKYRDQFKNGVINKTMLTYYLTDCQATLDALRWVLDENDRYD